MSELATTASTRTGDPQPPGEVLRRLDAVVACLRTVRLREAGQSEAEIRDALLKQLLAAGFPARKERPLGSRARADILVQDVVIEVKRARPHQGSVEAQLERYARIEGVSALVLVLERGIVVPEEFAGKPVRVVSLHALWGIVA